MDLNMDDGREIVISTMSVDANCILYGPSKLWKEMDFVALSVGEKTIFKFTIFVP
jgi:hypothetical protein